MLEGRLANVVRPSVLISTYQLFTLPHIKGEPPKSLRKPFPGFKAGKKLEEELRLQRGRERISICKCFEVNALRKQQSWNFSQEKIGLILINRVEGKVIRSKPSEAEFLWADCVLALGSPGSKTQVWYKPQRDPNYCSIKTQIIY